MDKDALHKLRKEYSTEKLKIKDLQKSPFKQFNLWFKEAVSKNVPEPNTFSLATVSQDGQPSNRTVLIKEMRNNGIVFYTNYRSRKGIQIANNPKVCACFFWQPIFKQVLIEGSCEKLSPKESDEYFNKRPLGSRIGAITSPQSQKIESRKWLELKWQENQEQLGDKPKRPEYWGGFLIRPTRFEFWQGQPSRLHDRFLYEIVDGKWLISRLAP